LAVCQVWSGARRHNKGKKGGSGGKREQRSRSKADEGIEGWENGGKELDPKNTEHTH